MKIVYIILGLIIINSFIVGIVLLIMDKNKFNNEEKLYDDPKIIFEDDDMDEEII